MEGDHGIAVAPRFSRETSCLLIIDVQARLLPVIAGGPAFVESVSRLAMAARILGIPVLATEQNSRGLGPTAENVRSLASQVLQKTHFDATREKHWPGFLPADRPHIVVAGSEAHVCVLQTIMGLLSGGARVKLVRDAVASRTLENKAAGLHRAEQHGAELVTTEMVVFEWLETCEHEKFREVLNLVK